jgi:hypothetical protein
VRQGLSMILDSIPFQPNLDNLLQYCHIRKGSPQIREIEAMLRLAEVIARPKAIFTIALVDKRGDEEVVMDGISFKSRVLQVNLSQVHRVFAYVATCGVEIQEWARSYKDALEGYWADAIMVLALGAASDALINHILERYQPGSLASMNPGSLEDWPITEQRPLFKLLGDVKAAIGVELTESLLMVPTKSVSGIYFQTESGYANCQLCPREICPNRRAQYAANLYAEKYSR